MKKILLITTAMVFSAAAYAGDPTAGKEKSKACAACHGDNGISQTADFPMLAGQYNDYLVHTLKDYQSGARKNPIMAGQVANLKPADIADIAAFYSAQRGLATKY